MKRILSLILCAALLLSCCPIIPLQVSATEYTEGYYTYEVYNGEATITGCDDTISGDVTVPSTLGGYPVTTIGDWAFSACENMTTVNIPDSVTAIGEGAFCECCDLISVTFGDNVVSIGWMAFYYTGLTTIEIPESVTDIGGSAFDGCGNLTSVTIPGSVKSIGIYAFRGCNLTNVTIPASVIAIEEGAFSDCYNLTGIWVDAGNQVYSSDDKGFLFNKDQSVLIQAPLTISGEYTIPDSVKEIGDWSFDYCTNLTTVIIPNSVSSVGYGAFNCCSKLANVTIPNSVTTIGGQSFYNCDNLTDVYYNGTQEQWKQITIGEYNEPLTDATLHIIEASTVVASGTCGENLTWTLDDEGTLTISGTGAMYDYSYYYDDPDGYSPWHSYRESIEKIIIESGVTNISGYAFYNCTNVTEVTIPNSVTAIGGYAFYGCASLTSVTIPNSVTTIGNYAFASCNSLISVTIPDSVTAIKGHIFTDCNSLTGIWVDENNPRYSSDDQGALYNKDKTVIIEIPDAISDSYLIPEGVVSGGHCGDNLTWTLDEDGTLTIFGTGSMWRFDQLLSDAFPSEFAPWIGERVWKVIIQSGVTAIADTAFYDCDTLTSVTIGDSVTCIGDGVFYDCDTLSSVTIGNSVTTIGNNAFDGCVSLVYNIFDNGSYLGNDFNPYLVLISFTDRSIADCNIHPNAKIIGDGAFFSCTSLTSVTIPDSVTTIGWYAFWGCRSLTSVIIPDSVTTIGSDAFSSCTSLTSVTIPDSVTTIGDWAFESCTSLTSVTIPQSVTTIGRYAFRSCTSLTSVTIPQSVTTIGFGAFMACTSLTDVYYNGTQEQWEQITIGEYNESLANAKIHTVDPIERMAVKVLPIKTIYLTGENIDTEGLVLAVKHSDGKTETVSEGYTVSGFDSTTTGKKTVTVTYEGCSTSFDVFVVGESDKIIDTDGNCFETLTEAIQEAVNGDKLTFVKNIIENATVDKTINIDLNGFSITGTLTVKDGSILYGMDVQTDDYTVRDGKGYGKISKVVLEGNGKLMGLPAESDLAEHGYMMITEDDGVSFHCVNLQLKTMSLRADDTGIYFKSDFAGDELVAENVKQFGVALSLQGTPNAANIDSHCKYSKFTGFAAGKNADTTSTLLKGVMKSGNAALINYRNANMPIYGRAYILTNEGEYIFGTAASRTFKQQVEAIDTMWSKLSATQKNSVERMYQQFTTVMKNWNLPNLKESMK